jgi:hypothetical protein
MQGFRPSEFRALILFRASKSGRGGCLLDGDSTNRVDFEPSIR